MYRRVSFSFVTMKACFMGVRTKACGFFAGHCLLTLLGIWRGISGARRSTLVLYLMWI